MRDDRKMCIRIVPHTHWDREWYFTSAKSQVYLVNNMAEILEMLEANPDYPCYVLDGQTAVLHDYLAVKPEDEDRIKSLVQAGRLKIGPWYTQTDEMVVAGESVVRNLLYGKLDCDKFGPRMMIGYLPDSFGQSAAFPKILNGFGIDKSLFWRGYSQRLGISNSEFLWQADDGSQVLVQLLPINYSVGITMPNNAKDLHDQLDAPLKKLTEYSTTGLILVPNGHDQMPIQQNIYEIIDLLKAEYPDFDVQLSSYEELFDAIEKDKVKTIKGELLDGKYMRIHRSIFSSRADIKTQNTMLENEITNSLEPIMSIAKNLGIEYQNGTLEEIWREMLKNHAHDSIGCCCTDSVNKQVQRRFDKAQNLVSSLKDFYMRKILEASDGEKNKLIIFNTTAKNKAETYKVCVTTLGDSFELKDADGTLIDYEIIGTQDIIARDETGKKPAIYHKFTIALHDEIPSMGYKIYQVINSEATHARAKNSKDAIIENEIYKIEINKNGTLNITDKNSGDVYKNVLLMQDSADGGDSYDYSPIENDYVLTSEKVVADIKTNKCSNFESAKINFKFEVPKDEKSRISKKIDGKMEFEIDINLDKNSSIIQVSVQVDNHAKDHRVRTLVPQNLSAKFSVADIQFGNLKRNVYDEAVEVWQSENWDERPDAIYPFLSYVHTDNKNGLAVLSNSVREFEIVDEKNYDTIAITLFRSYGHQGRMDLLRRPGRPSGTIEPTPDAQLLGKNTYELALTTQVENVPQLAKQYTSAPAYYSWDPREDLQLNSSKIKAPQKFSMFEIKNNALILSSIKKCETQDSLCIRLFNSSNENQILELESNLKICAELMLDETEIKKLDGKNKIEFKPFEIKTFLLKN